jgi:hypothetical protein
VNFDVEFGGGTAEGVKVVLGTNVVLGETAVGDGVNIGVGIDESGGGGKNVGEGKNVSEGVNDNDDEPGLDGVSIVGDVDKGDAVDVAEVLIGLEFLFLNLFALLPTAGFTFCLAILICS